MVRRFGLAVILLLTISAPLEAQIARRGDVFYGYYQGLPTGVPKDYALWIYMDGGPWATRAGGCRLIDKCAPYARPGLLVPRPDLYLFHTNGTVSWWNGIAIPATVPGLGYNEIFHDDTPLGDITAWPTGNFVVPELTNDASGTAKLIEFSLQRRVRDYSFPAGSRGARHIELLADQCTLLYTTGDDLFVHRMNVCSGDAQSDFTTLWPGQKAGVVRQLANRDVLVAAGEWIAQFHQDGTFVRGHPLDGAMVIALSTDGRSFWAGSVDAKNVAHLVHFDPETGDGNPRAVMIGNPGMGSLYVPMNASDLVVVGEWRAAMHGLRRRAITR